MKKKLLKIVLNPLFSGSAIMIIGSNSSNFLNYLFHLIMGRMLGPANYGELASLISIMGLIGVIPGSVALVIVKYISSAKSKDEINSLIAWLRDKTLKISLIIFLIILIISPAVTSFLHINSVIYLVFIAISFLFSLSAGFNRAILQGLLKFKEMVLSVLAEYVVKLILCITLVSLGFAVGGALVGLVISIAVGWYLTTLYISVKKTNSKNPNIRSMFLFTIPVVIQSVSTTSLYSSDLILVKHFFSSYEAGLYAALSTLGKIIFFATGPISAVMFPLVSKRASEGSSYKKIFILSFGVTAFFALILLSIYWFFPNLMIMLLYGSSYTGASNLLVWFGLFITLFTLSSLLINFNLSLGRTKLVLFPLLAALAQVVIIWAYHATLFNVIIISTVLTSLLLASLLVYSFLSEHKWKLS